MQKRIIQVFFWLIDMKIIIREAIEKDYEAICKLYFEGDTLHYTSDDYLFREPQPLARGKEKIVSILNDEKADLFIAEIDGEIVGVLHIYLKERKDEPPMKGRKLAHIDSIVVAKEYQGKGIGKQLMEKADAWARIKGLNEIELGVFEFNKEAIAFYEILGFKTVSRYMGKLLSE